MFFASIVRSKLASLLRPWLDEVLDVELKLRFRRSIVSAKSLFFSPSTLNPLVEKSTHQEVSIDVTIRPRECVDDERHVLGDFKERRRKEVMDALDPEIFELP